MLIAAGDTFRAGAVEQLRTHTKHLNSLHPNSVQLYEQGYGKDPAGLAAAAIAIGAVRLPLFTEASVAQHYHRFTLTHLLPMGNLSSRMECKSAPCFNSIACFNGYGVSF